MAGLAGEADSAGRHTREFGTVGPAACYLAAGSGNERGGFGRVDEEYFRDPSLAQYSRLALNEQVSEEPNMFIHSVDEFPCAGGKKFEAK
jgi:hypothetical protein